MPRSSAASASEAGNAVGEFELIRQFFDKPAKAPVTLGIGDDAAVLACKADQQWAVCADTMVLQRHFSAATPAHAVGWKALAVNLSDLAAMAAKPSWFQLALTLPAADPSWLAGFAEGLFDCANTFDCQLIGGDTTRGPLTITVQAAGTLPAAVSEESLPANLNPSTCLTRAGATAGDRLIVSGHLGAAALALQLGEQAPADWQRALDYPQPRVALGLLLRGLASSCIDISDGLLADLGHILERSSVGADLQVAAIPVAKVDPNAGLQLTQQQLLEAALSGGDDYELLFTLPDMGNQQRNKQQLTELSQQAQLPLQEIGRISAQLGLRCHNEDGSPYTAAATGFQHF